MTDSNTSKIEKLKKQQAALAARIQQMEAREREAARKQDTRLKIILGGAVLAALADNPELARLVKVELSARVTKPNDRAAVARLLEAHETTTQPEPPKPSG